MLSVEKDFQGKLSQTKVEMEKKISELKGLEVVNIRPIENQNRCIGYKGRD